MNFSEIDVGYQSYKTVDKTLDHDVKIEIEVTAVADDFKTLADTAGSQFGKYTIVISDKKPQ